VLHVVGADAVDVARTELAGDDEEGISGSGDGVSTTEIDAVSWTGVGVVSEDAIDSDDSDALITGSTVEEMLSVSVLVSIGTSWASVDAGVGVIVGSTDVSSMGVDVTEETVSTSEEAASDEASGAAAVLESSAGMVGDSERLSDTLEELATGSVGAVISEVVSELVDVV
jgi:hypothetical protein